MVLRNDTLQDQSFMVGITRTTSKWIVCVLLHWTLELLCLSDAIVQAANVTTRYLSKVTPNSSDPAVRRLVEGLQCDLSLYNDFIESDEGQDIFITATLCESRIVYLKNKRAGSYGPISQADLVSAMCSDECLRSDELHKKAMSLSRCTCAEVSAETFVRHDFCLESSARLLCSHLGECGHWGCQLEDFNCLRYEWDRLYPCSSSQAAVSVVVVLLAVAVAWLT